MRITHRYQWGKATTVPTQSKKIGTYIIYVALCAKWCKQISTRIKTMATPVALGCWAASFRKNGAKANPQATASPSHKYMIPLFQDHYPPFNEPGRYQPPFFQAKQTYNYLNDENFHATLVHQSVPAPGNATPYGIPAQRHRQHRGNDAHHCDDLGFRSRAPPHSTSQFGSQGIGDLKAMVGLLLQMTIN